jgi:hypothetical protein
MTALAATAPRGEIHVLNSADYGPLVITKSVTITSEGAVAGILATGSTAITVKAGPSDVVSLRGLEVDGDMVAAIGILFASGQSLNIQKTVFRGFTNTGVAIMPTAGGSFFIADTQVANSRNSGILIVSSQAPVSGTLSRVTATANGVGIYALGNNATLTVTDSVAGGNGTGIASNAAASIMVRNSTINGNTAGVHAANNGIIRIGHSAITANDYANVASDGGQIQSFGNNLIAGNKSEAAMSSALALR